MDFAITLSGFTTENMEGLEMAPSLFYREIFFVVKKPGPKLTVWQLITPFTPYVWLAALVSVLCAIAALLLITALSPSEHKLDVFDSTWAILGIMINESIPSKLMLPFQLGSKHIFLFMWCLCSLLIGLSYQSILLASLTKVSLEEPIDTYQQIIDAKVPLFVLKGTEVEELMETSPLAIVQKAYQMNVLDMNAFFSNNLLGGSSPDEVLKASEEGRAALVTSTSRVGSISHWAYRGR